MDHDPALNVTTLFDLTEAMRLWCPVAPEFGDMRDAARELIYLLVSRRTHADRLQTVMHQRFFPAFPHPFHNYRDREPASSLDLSASLLPGEALFSRIRASADFPC